MHRVSNLNKYKTCSNVFGGRGAINVVHIVSCGCTKGCNVLRFWLTKYTYVIGIGSPSFIETPREVWIMG